jgi:hypothetical protein
LNPPNIALDVCSCLQPAGLEPENSGTSLIESPTSENAVVLFMQQNPVQRASTRGYLPNFRMFAVPVCAFRLCADGPGQPFSNSHGLETSFPHCTVALSMIEVFLRIDIVGTVLPLLCVWILRSTHEGIFTSSPRRTLDRPGVPTTLPHTVLFIQLLSWQSCHIVQGPTRLGPQILSFSSSVKLLKQKETTAKPHGAPARLK